MPSDVEEEPGLLTDADSGRENAFDDSVSFWDDDDAELIEHMGALAAEGCSGSPDAHCGRQYAAGIGRIGSRRVSGEKTLIEV